MNKNKGNKNRTLSGPMLGALLVMSGAKRIGLAKPMLKRAIKKMFFSKAIKQSFGSYEAQAADVFVTTFAKSGTNWMMQIAQQIAFYGDAEFDHIHDVAAWPDAPSSGPIPLSDMSARDVSPTGLRIIKTHLDANCVPYDERATYLTVIRDPKEVTVSAYYFLLGIFDALDYVSPEDWFDLFMESEVLGRAWATHTDTFWRWRDRPNVLVFTYDELKENPEECVKKVAKQMGVALNSAQFSKVIERISFEHMRANEAQFSPPRSPFVKEKDATVMLRSGKIGGSSEMLSLAQQAEIDKLALAALKQIGSDFPYETLFNVVNADLNK